MSAPRMADLIARLDGLDASGDIEEKHLEADGILLEALRLCGAADVADAWIQACKRVGFWYA